MKKFINDPYDVMDEMLEGFLYVHKKYVRKLDAARTVVRADVPVANKVGVITGGGSGHKPAFIGFIGQGMLDAVVGRLGDAEFNLADRRFAQPRLLPQSAQRRTHQHQRLRQALDMKTDLPGEHRTGFRVPERDMARRSVGPQGPIAEVDPRCLVQ